MKTFRNFITETFAKGTEIRRKEDNNRVASLKKSGVKDAMPTKEVEITRKDAASRLKKIRNQQKVLGTRSGKDGVKAVNDLARRGAAHAYTKSKKYGGDGKKINSVIFRAEPKNKNQ